MSQQAIDVLLVEDDPYWVELTMRVLKQQDLDGEVHVVKDGAEALDFVFGEGKYADREGAKPPRVILLDLKLPKVSGVDVLRRIKSDPDARLIPVVAVTASADERDVLITYELGVNSYVVKPVDFATFARTVVNLVLYWLRTNRVPP